MRLSVLILAMEQQSLLSSFLRFAAGFFGILALIYIALLATSKLGLWLARNKKQSDGDQ